jgi:hypothetical protein
MIRHMIAAGLVLAAHTGCAQEDAQAQPAAEASAEVTLSASDRDAAFRAAGFTRVGAEWRNCDDPGTASYTPGEIEQSGDFNGDGRPVAVIVEGSTYCLGMTGTGFSLVSKQTDGSWKLLTGNTGVLSFLDAKGSGGWPDISVGGPGFCFPVERWDGKEYKARGFEYQGKSCRPEE